MKEYMDREALGMPFDAPMVKEVRLEEINLVDVAL